MIDFSKLPAAALILDFETASDCDLPRAGPWRYAEHPTTEILSLSWGFPGGPISSWVPDDGLECPAELVDILVNRPNVWFTAHNAAFEKAIWRTICVKLFGWPDIPNSRWHDTQAVCAMKVLPMKLDQACRALHLPFQKDKEGSRLTKLMSKPNKKGYYDRSPETVARSLEYNQSDIRAQGALHHRLGWMPADERQVWLLDQRINERGFKVDMDLVRSMQRVVDKATGPLAEEFRDLTGGLEFTQIAKVGEWVRGQGVALPNMQKETLARLLGESEDDDPGAFQQDLPPNVQRALHIRQLVGSASVQKLAAITDSVGADGRARGTLQYHGAGPGRWAGRLLQPQNFPRGTNEMIQLSVEEKIAAIQTEDPGYIEGVYGVGAVEFVVGSLRHMITAEEDRQLVSGDFSGIEARLVLALAGQHDKTALLAAGFDAYIDMAIAIYKMNLPAATASDKALIKAFKEAHTEERQIGKNTILGCGFGMGPPKFHDRYCPDQPIEFAERVIETYRKEWAPEVPKLWRGLEAAAVRCVHDRVPKEAYGVRFEMTDDNFLTARLPSGRKLWYFNPQATRRAMPWDDTDIRLSYTYQARKNGHLITIDGYGGLVTENVVQALARDLLVIAMFKCEREGLPIVLTVHDEIVAEPKNSLTSPFELIRQIMEDSPDWAKAIQVPISVEGWEGPRYKK